MPSTDATLIRVLIDAGFKRCGRREYHLPVEPPIKWIVALEYLGRGRRNSAGIGLGHKPARWFSTYMLRKYGGPMWRRRKFDVSSSTICYAEIQRLTWIGRTFRRGDASLLRAMAEAREKGDAAVFSEYAQPLIARIKTERDCLRVLQADAEPYPWPASNPARRIAEIALLRTRLDESTATLGEEFGRQARHVEAQLNGPHGDAKISFHDYIRALTSEIASYDEMAVEHYLLAAHAEGMA
jgi:hypothetical protein